MVFETGTGALTHWKITSDHSSLKKQLSNCESKSLYNILLYSKALAFHVWVWSIISWGIHSNKLYNPSTCTHICIYDNNEAVNLLHYHKAEILKEILMSTRKNNNDGLEKV